MTITMQNVERLSLAEMKKSIEGSGTVGFVAQDREAVYGFIERVLKAQQYRRLSKGQYGCRR